MKHTKRNITIAATLILVCGAVYMNWSYNTQFGKSDPERVQAEDAAAEAAAIEDSEAVEAAADEAEPVSDYFAEARLSRQRSRDEAVTLLENAAATDGATPESVDNAMNAIAAMADTSMAETQIENLLLAKNYADCVAYIQQDSITVAVPAPEEGLTAEQVAAITDVVTSQTAFSASQLKVVEVKG